MKVKNDVEVLINGRKYTICGFESAEYLQKVATYINSKYAEFKDKSYYHTLDVELRNILLAINIADDYFKADKDNKSMKRDNERKDKMVLDMKHEIMESQSQSEAVTIQIEELRARCEKAEKEIVAWNVKCQETTSKATALEEQLKQSQSENSANSARLEDTLAQVSKLENEKARLESQVESLNVQIKDQELKAADQKKQQSSKLAKAKETAKNEKEVAIAKVEKAKEAEIAKLKKEQEAQLDKLKKEHETAITKAVEETKKENEDTAALLDEYADENEELKAKLEAAERRITELESRNRRGKR